MSAQGTRVAAQGPTAADPGIDEPNVRQRLRRQRSLIAVVLAVLAIAILLAWAGGGSSRGWLDPGSPEPDGSRALASLLADQGVEVVPVRTAAEAAERSGPGTTLLVAGTELLMGRVRERIADAAPDLLVLVEPDQSDLDALVPGAQAAGFATVEVRQPRCDDPVADRAGSAVIGGTTFTDDAGSSTGCYPGEDGDALLVVPASDGRGAATLLGSGVPLTNDRLADEGNAALAMGVLGSRPVLVWYRPSITDPLLSDEESATPESLLPGWVPIVLAQFLIAALVAAWWRGRRLGPVVSEPLPVVVRAAETTEGRARLYRRAHDRGHAAAALRRRAREAAARAAGVPPRAGPQALVAAVAARTGRPAPHVAALLLGGEPADDAALARLATDLDALVAEVRRT